jgi:hypothetical protein
MSEIDPENTENGGGASGTSVVAQGTIEASQRALDRVRAEFPEDELVLQRTPDQPSNGATAIEIQAGEGETLLQFHEACRERGITFDVTRLSRQ